MRTKSADLTIYGSSLLGLGYLFNNQVEQIGRAISRIGGSALSLLAALAGGYAAYKLHQRRRLLRDLSTAKSPSRNYASSWTRVRIRSFSICVPRWN